MAKIYSYIVYALQLIAVTSTRSLQIWLQDNRIVIIGTLQYWQLMIGADVKILVVFVYK